MRDATSILVAVLILSGCGSFTETRDLKKPLKEVRKNIVIPVVTPEKTLKRPDFLNFLEEKSSMIVGLVGLFCIWFLVRVYEAEKRRKAKLGFDDLAVIKLGKNVFNMMWKRFRPRDNIIKLNDHR